MKRPLLNPSLICLTAVSLGFATACAGASAGAVPNLKAGQHIVFKAGALKPGSSVACTSHGIRIVARVQARGHSVAKIADGVAGGSATLRLTTRADSSVVAHCR